MTAGVFGAAPDAGPDPLSVEHVAPLVAYLASPAADAISGQVFVVYGGMVVLMAAPAVEARFDVPPTGVDGGLWTVASLGDTLGEYFADRDPARTFASTDILTLA
jgi:3-oxoacyl-[acyl-carrier protein] reductase